MRFSSSLLLGRTRSTGPTSFLGKVLPLVALSFLTTACGGSTDGSGNATGGTSSGGAASGGAASGGGSGKSCTVGDKTYADGESIPSDCPSCWCSDGNTACTLNLCVETCGGLVGRTCSDGQFCLYDEEASCGAGDGAGTCTNIPNACTDEYDPVCGCDGKNYSSPCEAHAAGANVASEGTCPPPP